jgi:hypothetical protein
VIAIFTGFGKGAPFLYAGCTLRINPNAPKAKPNTTKVVPPSGTAASRNTKLPSDSPLHIAFPRAWK